MYEIKLTDEFSRWLNTLKDNTTRIRLARRLEKASRGLLGDVKSVGDGVYEMREHFGSGWRMYYVQHGTILIIMLSGGDKAAQRKDIELAKAQAIQLEG
ncbi:addiction module killer protein [Marinomonas primoryensis]|uniref:Addiction module killer protein n=1 Tax=Marinomonas primoryensis TaxID=178399 RepID=A0A2Z4PNZ7_9GAMM|nr:type II toxin-antitoxin system RelE/ParE family toxin [Marinomonas primoryensis]AWX99231.1 addiction module killer protein [Marinomonas primoryensis]